MPEHLFLFYVCTSLPSSVYYAMLEPSTYWSWHLF